MMVAEARELRRRKALGLDLETGLPIPPDPPPRPPRQPMRNKYSEALRERGTMYERAQKKATETFQKIEQRCARLHAPPRRRARAHLSPAALSAVDAAHPPHHASIPHAPPYRPLPLRTGE
jgi:hypothetical protein